MIPVGGGVVVVEEETEPSRNEGNKRIENVEVDIRPRTPLLITGLVMQGRNANLSSRGRV